MAAGLVHTAAFQTVTGMRRTELVPFHGDHLVGLSAHLTKCPGYKGVQQPPDDFDTCRLCGYKGVCGVQATHVSHA